MIYPYFMVEFRGIKAMVEPDNSLGCWEYNFIGDEHGKWKNLGIGRYPAAGVAEARLAIMKKLRRKLRLEVSAPGKLLRLLLSKFYKTDTGALEWGYNEGVTLNKVLGQEAADEMMKYWEDEG